ncbi:MAG TPA: hypothetical protein VF680_11605 [Allosphingosinicella sp.]|jgi:hypothetical protein
MAGSFHRGGAQLFVAAALAAATLGLAQPGPAMANEELRYLGDPGWPKPRPKPRQRARFWSAPERVEHIFTEKPKGKRARRRARGRARGR